MPPGQKTGLWQTFPTTKQKVSNEIKRIIRKRPCQLLQDRVYQGDREGRPYNTTKRLTKPVYCTGDPRGRPGKFLTDIVQYTLTLAYRQSRRIYASQSAWYSSGVNDRPVSPGFGLCVLARGTKRHDDV